MDDRFAALREVIAGRTDGGQSGGGTMQIASLLTMLNEYYTQLTIADSALAAGRCQRALLPQTSCNWRRRNCLRR